MITHLSQEEIKKSYEALDVSLLALDLLLHIKEVPNTEADVNKCLADYHLLLEQNAPDWHLCVDAISIYSLVQHCMELLGDGTLPQDLFDQSLFKARNMIFTDVVLPFVSAVASAFHEVIQDVIAVQEWKDKIVSGLMVEHAKFWDTHPASSKIGRALCFVKEKQLRNHPSDEDVIKTVLAEEAMGMIDPEFVRGAFIELNDILDREIKKNCAKPLADQLFAHVSGFKDG